MWDSLVPTRSYSQSELQQAAGVATLIVSFTCNFQAFIHYTYT